MDNIKGMVLIVDDVISNIRVIFDLLTDYGYEVLIAESGEDAINISRQNTVDLVLLDVIMPEMDGFETYKILRTLPQMELTPIIFMTGLSDTEEKVRAFQMGAVDYITKPFHQEEVIARVNTHISVQQLQKTLRLQNEELCSFQKERNEFINITIHNLKNPLSSIQSLTALMITEYDKLDKEKILECLQMVQHSSVQMQDLIKLFLNLNLVEEDKLILSKKNIDLLALVQKIIADYYLRAHFKRVIFYLNTFSVSHFSIYANEEIIGQILEHLFSNALKYSPPNCQINILLTHQTNYVRCAIQDFGKGLSLQDQQLLFNKFAHFSTRPTAGENTIGLGLYLTKKLVEKMNGRIGYESQLGKGTTFFVELPITALAQENSGNT